MPCFVFATLGGGGSLFDYFSALATELASRGHRAIIILDGQHREAEDPERNPSILTWPSPRATEWRDARFLHALIARHRPVCVVGNFSAVNICTLEGWLDRVSARVAWSHTLMKQIEMDSVSPRWKLRYLALRKRCVFRFATHHVVASEALARELRATFRVPSARIRVLPFLLPDPPPNDAPLRRNVVLCPSRHAPSKGQGVLIRALPLVRAECPDAVVEFVGGGPSREANERLAAALNLRDACDFLGALPTSRVLERMASAALVAMPSLEEAFGLTNVEAASVGAPVVGSAVGGMREIVVEGETGYLVPPGDPPALAGKIVRILKDENLRRRLGHAARARFESLYSARHIAKHADFFESLAGGPGS